MADALRYAIKIMPIVGNAGGTDGELSSINLDSRAKILSYTTTLASDGNAPQTGRDHTYDAYDENGILQCISSGGDVLQDAIPVDDANAVWIRNTGFKYDDSKVGNIDWSSPEPTVVLFHWVVFGSNVVPICYIEPKSSIFIKPAQDNIWINGGEEGNPVAVELIIFT